MATSPSEHVPPAGSGTRGAPVFDVVVVGAGPAGLAAATTAAGHGARVALLDAGAAPGGQYWRQPVVPGSADPGPQSGSRLDPGRLAHLHHDLATFRRLRDRLAAEDAAGRLDYFPQHHVWTVGREGDAFSVRAVDRAATPEAERVLRGSRLVLATGGYDRQVPFPGWDLPGVLTAGGAQALLKGHGVTAGRRVVVAGTGPFLLPVAAGLAAAGATVVGVHEAGAPSRWLRHAPAIARNAGKLGEGAGYARTLVRHRVPVRTRSVLVAAHGTDALEEATFARADGRGGVVAGTERRVRADALAVGWGFTPQLELPLALGCATRVDLDGSVVCVVDEAQRSTVPDVWVAGETCGIGGAALAVVEGSIAGDAAAGAAPDRGLRRRRAALRGFAAAMHLAHPVPTAWQSRLDPATVVCRCEEVTAGRLREAVERLGATDARTAKLVSRPGMGWCQGRVCGYATACLTATWSGTPYSPQVVGSRPVATPITLGALAAGEEL